MLVWQSLGYDFPIDVNNVPINGSQYSLNSILNDYDPSFFLAKKRFDSNPLIQVLRPDVIGLGSAYSASFRSLEISDNPAHMSMADYLFAHENVTLDKSAHAHLLEDLDRYRSKAALISLMNEKDIEASFMESLDLVTYRLDAWIHGLYAKRLSAMRMRGTTGASETEIVNGQPKALDKVHFGAYGYVECLSLSNEDDSEQSQLEIVHSNQVPAEFADMAELKIDTSWDGYLIAPSMPHAVTAAVLRSAYLSSRILEQSAVHDRLSIRLSSSRVRTALQLLNGVRDGQDLGHLLGYQLEKGLHERSGTNAVELDKYIYALRKRFPIASVDGQAPDQGELRSGVVLDGLKLSDHILEQTSADVGVNDSIYSRFKDSYSNLGLVADLEIPPDTELASFRAFLFEVDAMVSSMDALSDLLVSEGVFQMVQGNLDRASAVMSMMSGVKGIVNPEIVDTPRSEYTIQNRLINTFPIAQNLAEGIPQEWNFSGSLPSPMAAAEPSLNKWLGSLMGPPSTYVFSARTRPSETISWSANQVYSLVDLGLQPIDLIMMLGKDMLDPQAFFSKRMRQHIRMTASGNLGHQADVEFTFTGVAQSASQVDLDAALPFFEAIYKSIIESRLCTASDFEHHEGEGGHGYDLVQALGRVDDMTARLSDLLIDARTGSSSVLTGEYVLGDFSDRSVAELIELIRRVSLYNFTGAIAEIGSVAGDSEGADYNPVLFGQMVEVLRSHCLILHDRYTRVSAIRDSYTGLTGDNEKWEALEACAKIVYGKAFKLIPLVGIRNLSDLDRGLDSGAQSDLFQNGDRESALDTWMHSLSVVRERISSFSEIRLYNELFGQSTDSLTAVQLPYVSGDYWLGGEFPNDHVIEPKTSIVFSGTMAQTMCGLKIDDWNEAIPQNKIKGGIAYHMNQPGAEAPQAVLLAVPAGLQADWDVDDLLYSVVETIDMAKYRSVEPGDLMEVEGLSKFFPATNADAYPANPDGAQTEENKGIRPSFDYFKNSI